MASDEDFLGGLTTRKMTGMIGSILQKQHGKKRYELNRMGEIAEFLQDTALDEQENIGNRLQAVGHCISLDKLNFEQEKLEVQVELAMAKAESGSEEKSDGPQVILVLPENGSEVKA